MRLYRATDDDRYTGTRSCWTSSAECARAYTDNPGYGGEVLLAVDIDPRNVLDLRAEDAATWRLLAKMADREWTGNAAETFGGLSYVHEVVEERIGLRELAEMGYEWVVYLDSYPEDCDTWVWLGSEPLAAEEIEDD